jgi:hypothetical protein
VKPLLIMALLIIALLLSGCASTPTKHQPLSPAEVTVAWDTRVPALQDCYRGYVATFGGTLEDGERLSSQRGPTVAAGPPFQGEVVFTVEVDASGTTATTEPAPDPALVSCWINDLQRVDWPAEPPATITRAITFDIVPAE